MSYVRTPEICLAISLRMKGKRHGLGHKMSTENKEKLSLRMLGNQYTKGLKQTEEAKRKISEANKGKPGNGRGIFVRTPEMRQAQSEMMKGNKFRAGKTHSPEEREKARQSMFLFYDAKHKKEVEAENPIYRLPNGDLRPDFFEIWNKQHGIEPVKEEPKPKLVPVPAKKKSGLVIEFNRKQEPNAYALGRKLNHPWAQAGLLLAAKRRKR